MGVKGKNRADVRLRGKVRIVKPENYMKQVKYGVCATVAGMPCYE
ncbi:hypothetical protein [Polaromonas sp. CG9_12]|nr:hypothetical protein [Polaromonas sp. CG9_12]